MTSLRAEVIGLIPAGGQGTRIGPLPCSKEIFPIGFDQTREGRPKAICNYLIDRMRFAGIKKAYIVLREGKWDIPAYLRDGKISGINLAYLIMDAPFGVPFTIDQAFPFVQDANIAFGFPDIFCEPDDIFIKLLNRLTLRDCDVVLGLFPSDRPDKADMVDFGPDGKIRDIIIKQAQSKLEYTWGTAVWTPAFTRFIHHYVEVARPSIEQQKELFIGEVVRAAINVGVRVEAIHVSDTPFLDIGTPEDLSLAAKQLMSLADNLRKT